MITRYRPPSSRATSSISIGICNKRTCNGCIKLEPKVHCATNISENSLKSCQMRLSRIMHMKANLLHCIRDIWTSKCKGFHNVPPNGVFGNKVYGSDSEGFGMNPSSNEFRLCNSDDWRSGNYGGRVIIRGYGGGGDMVVHHGLKGCLDHRIIRSSPILPPLP
ncbi:hypothetical protein Tco_1345439 [Tanacetum coccineum]